MSPFLKLQTKVSWLLFMAPRCRYKVTKMTKMPLCQVCYFGTCRWIDVDMPFSWL